MNATSSSFKKYLVLVVAGATLVILMSFATLVVVANRNVRTVFLALQNQKGEQIQRFLDTEVFAFAYETVARFLIEPEPAAIRDFFLYNEWESGRSLIEQTLTNTVLLNRWVESVLLYREDGAYVADLWTQTVLTEGPEGPTIDGVVRFVQQSDTSQGWIAWSSPMFSGRVLSFYHKLPVTDTNRNRGFILISLGVGRLDSGLAPMLDPQGFGMLVLNSDGEPLFRSPDGAPDWIAGTFTGLAGRSFFVQHRGTPYLVKWNRLSAGKIVVGLYLRSKMLNRQIRTAQRLFFSLGVFLVFVCIAPLVLVSESLGRPIHLVLTKLGENCRER